jgi:hypothetical protein
MRSLKIVLSLAVLLASLLASVPAEAAKKRRPFFPGKTSPKEDRSHGKNDGRNFAPHFRMAPAPAFGPFLEVLKSEEQFDEISSHSEGLVKSDLVKFLIDNRGPEPKVYFINGNFHVPTSADATKYHYNFAESFLKFDGGADIFNEITYFTRDPAQKKFIAGSLQHYKLDGGEDFYGIQFYPQDKIAEGMILFAAKAIKGVFQMNAKLSFVSYGIQQTVNTVKGELASLGVEVRSLTDIYARVPYMPMNQGEAWGYLRVNAKTEQLRPDDIPLFNELPLDLSVVAATITTVIQDAGSHVNLKSKERGTPNMVLRDQEKVKQLISDWRDQPIHLRVTSQGYTVEASTKEEVAKHVKKNSSRPWQNFPVGKSRALKTYDEMAQAAPTAAASIPDSKEFGGKGAKLGFLAHKDILGEGSRIRASLGHRLTPLGFAIPMAYYFDLVNANPLLKGKIDALIASEMGDSPLSSERKVAAIEEIHQLFYKAKIPSALVQELGKKMQQFAADLKRAYPKSELKKMKFRSSANAEDVENFDGAGLHDSFSAKLKDGLGDPEDECKVVVEKEGVTTKQEVEPETPLCALRGVYASLWNKRAVEERTYARINHATAAMGIAVNQNYSFREKSEKVIELANGVLVTRILAGEGVYGYQMSFNTEENLVTNPPPGTQSEVVLATFLGDERPEYTITQYAKTAPDQPVLDKSLVGRAVFDRVVALAKTVEKGYCRAVPSFYHGDCEFVTSDPTKPKALDLEFKIFSNGEVLVKQTREFGGR